MTELGNDNIKDAPSYICGQIEGSIDALNICFDKQDQLELSLFLQNPALLSIPMDVTTRLKKLVSKHSMGWEISLYDMLVLRNLHNSYVKLALRIADAFQKALNEFSSRSKLLWADQKTIEQFVNEKHGAEREDITAEYLQLTNDSCIDSREKTFTALEKIAEIIFNEFMQGKKCFKEICYEKDEIAKCFEDSVRNYSRELGKKTLRDLKHEAQRFKTSRSASLTPEVWGMLMENENKALDLAIKGKLLESEDEHYDAFTEDMRKKMEHSYELMQKILTMSSDDNLFDFEYAAEPHINFFESLNKDNVDLAHEIILRHNIIRCETFPALKAGYEQWLNKEDETSTLSEADQALLDRLLGYVAKGDWQNSATSVNVRLWISTLFGANNDQLDAIDIEETRQFRDFFKRGRGGANTDRVEVSMANILGYLRRYQLLAGGQKQISNAVFGNVNQVGNINKGHDKNASQAFANLESLMDKYRQKLIV